MCTRSMYVEKVNHIVRQQLSEKTAARELVGWYLFRAISSLNQAVQVNVFTLMKSIV